MKHNPFDSQDFYELMQNYRNAPLSNQKQVAMAFLAVKIFCENEICKMLDSVYYEWLEMNKKAD